MCTDCTRSALFSNRQTHDLTISYMPFFALFCLFYSNHILINQRYCSVQLRTSTLACLFVFAVIELYFNIILLCESVLFLFYVPPLLWLPKSSWQYCQKKKKKKKMQHNLSSPFTKLLRIRCSRSEKAVKAYVR